VRNFGNKFMEIKYIKYFDLDLKELGGKGYYISLLQKNNIQTPNGFIIPSSILSRKKYSEEEILHFFDGLKCQYVSVRSSASNEDSKTESLAGFYRSFLFVTRNQLFCKIQDCYNYYLSSRNEESNFAIIVQEMVNGEISGICFTSEPLTGKKQYVIEAAYGLCDGLVSGKVTPIRLNIDSSGNIKETVHFQNLQCVYNFEQARTEYVEIQTEEFVRLTQSQITTITETSDKIRQLIGCDVDIEWCIKKPDTLYILQARPITSINKQEHVDKTVYYISYRETDTIWSQDLGVRARVESPYQFNRFRDVLRFSNGTEFITLISEADKKDTENYSTSLYSDKVSINSIFAEISKDYEQQNRLFNRWKNIDYTALSDDEIQIIFEQMVSIVLKSNRFYEITSTEYTTLLLKKIQKQLGEHFNLLVEPFELDLIEKEILDWYKMFLDFDGVYEANLIYSHIFKYPWLCWGMTSYNEINHYLKNRWDITIKEFKDIKNKLDKKQNDRVLRNALKSTLINSSFIHLRDTIELVHQISLSRMKIKNAWAGIFLFMLPLINEVANRRNLLPQIVHQYYRSDEIITLLTEYKQVAAEAITERKDNVLWYHNKFYQGQQAVVIFNKLNVYSDSEIKGEMVYPGNVKGKVYLWDSYNITNLEKLKVELEQAKNEKFIFICSMAQPSITQYFSSCHAIITEEGGILSHAAIIAREQKIPCIVGVDKIMEKVKHLQEITIFSDGTVVLS